MTIQSIERAVQEAERFLAAVRELKVGYYDSAKNERGYCEWNERDDVYCNLATGKASGSVRRASLDLTRALAEMRKP